MDREADGLERRGKRPGALSSTVRIRGDSLHLIQKGRFAVRVMTPLGDVATIAVRGPGESFGEMPLVSEAPRRSATVAALEEAEAVAVYRNEFDLLRQKQPHLNEILFRFLTNEVRVLNERLLEARYLSVDKRVRRRVVELADSQASASPALFANI